MPKMIVTPWEVSGEIDYAKLMRDFGTQPITEEILARLKKHTGELHPFLRRQIYFSHRDLDWILDKYEAGEKFVLYTGQGPSSKTHLGHLTPWILTKHLQDKFGAELYFQLTDDEKFLVRKIGLEEANKNAYENALDVVACGFDQKKTFIFADTDYIKTQYKCALEVAKRVTFSTARAVFGFTNDSNIGIIFFPAVQAVPCFLPSILKKKNVPVLIPAAIDQDPYWRMARDVANKLGFYKPAQIHGKFLPGLAEGGKMSASIPSSSIFTTDTEKQIREKVLNAFTGGQPTIAEQKKLGGKPEICSAYAYFYFLFEPDDKKLRDREAACKSGKLMCGECKRELADRVVKFILAHQKKREKARSVLDKFIVRD